MSLHLCTRNNSVGVNGTAYNRWDIEWRQARPQRSDFFMCLGNMQNQTFCSGSMWDPWVYGLLKSCKSGQGGMLFPTVPIPFLRTTHTHLWFICGNQIKLCMPRRTDTRQHTKKLSAKHFAFKLHWEITYQQLGAWADAPSPHNANSLFRLFHYGQCLLSKLSHCLTITFP